MPRGMDSDARHIVAANWFTIPKLHFRVACKTDIGEMSSPYEDAAGAMLGSMLQRSQVRKELEKRVFLSHLFARHADRIEIENPEELESTLQQFDFLWNRLTAREQKVVETVNMVFSVTAAAKELGISIKAAESHIGQSLKKLGLNMTQILVMLALRDRQASAQPKATGTDTPPPAETLEASA